MNPNMNPMHHEGHPGYEEHHRHHHPVEECVRQIGTGFVPKGMSLYPCDIHGHFLGVHDHPNPVCPLCVQVEDNHNGTTASDISPVKDNNIQLTINL